MIVSPLNPLRVATFAILTLFGCLGHTAETPGNTESSDQPSESIPTYTQQIEQFRIDFFAQFTDKVYSPIRTKDDLAKLRFYDPNPSYRFDSQFDLATEESPVRMVTTTGDMAPFLRFAWITFEHQNNRHRLAVYKRDYDGPDFYFIPFKDQTNGDETYGGGRYLGFKLEEVNGGKVTLDFNKAYNPWCHYDEKLACPLPPDENSLPIEIHAGEKKYAFKMPELTTQP